MASLLLLVAHLQHFVAFPALVVIYLFNFGNHNFPKIQLLACAAGRNTELVFTPVKVTSK